MRNITTTIKNLFSKTEQAQPTAEKEIVSGKGFTAHVSQSTLTLAILSVVLIAVLLIFTGTADTVLVNLSTLNK